MKGDCLGTSEKDALADQFDSQTAHCRFSSSNAAAPNQKQVSAWIAQDTVHPRYLGNQNGLSVRIAVWSSTTRSGYQKVLHLFGHRRKRMGSIVNPHVHTERTSHRLGGAFFIGNAKTTSGRPSVSRTIRCRVVWRYRRGGAKLFVTHMTCPLETNAPSFTKLKSRGLEQQHIREGKANVTEVRLEVPDRGLQEKEAFGDPAPLFQSR